MAVSKRLRYEILRRDNHACRYCGATAPGVKLNVDHVIPQALGGSDEPTNLVTACADCNSGKTSSLPNAEPVADVDQETFRRAAELTAEQAQALSEHLWKGGYPPQWTHRQVELHAADEAWRYAWCVSSSGGDPSPEQCEEFRVHVEALFEVGHSAAEVLCAAVSAGSRQTPHLSWGLGVHDLRHAPISGEQYTRIHDVYDRWLDLWRWHGGPDPSAEERNFLRGQLVIAARSGESRESIQIASGMAAGSRSANLGKFLCQLATEDAEPVGGGN